MKTRRLHGTDLDLSVMGVGCWAMGGLWWGDDVTDENSVATIETALEHGDYWFDTAPLYGHGHADEVLTRGLGAKRHEVTIATKVGIRWDGAGNHARSDLTPAHIRSDVEASLRRLKLDQIPLLQIHWPCELDTDLKASLDELVALQDEGKIRYIGLCNYSEEGMAAAMKHAPVVSLQTPYSMLRREFEHGLKEASSDERGDPRFSVIAYEALARGLLTGKFTREQRFPKTDLRARDDRFKGMVFLRINVLVRKLERVAQKVGVPTSALALAWVAQRAGVTTVLAGCKRPEQLRENIQLVRILDHPKLWEVVDRVLLTHRH